MKINVIGGIDSQSSIAAKERDQLIKNENLVQCNWDTLIDAIKNDKSSDSIYPIWNNNEGYVKAIKLNETIFDPDIAENIHITDMWSKVVQFFAGFLPETSKKGNQIISVKVARNQCSKWFEEKGKLESEFFVSSANTTTAVEEYLKTPEKFERVLCTNEQISNNGLVSEENEVQNDPNFTTFLRSSNTKNKKKLKEGYSILSIRLSSSENEISPHLKQLIKILISNSESISEIPKISFIINLDSEYDGMLLEIKNNRIERVLQDIKSEKSLNETEEGLFQNDIRIISRIGEIKESFINSSLNNYLHKFKDDKFFFKYIPKHLIDVESIPVIYAIPKFNFFIHGFGEGLVREVTVRYLEEICNAIRKQNLSVTDDEYSIYLDLQQYIENNGSLKNLEFFDI